VVVCLDRGADLHMAQLMPLPLNAPCFSDIQISFTFLASAHPDSPGKGPLNVRVCVFSCGPHKMCTRPVLCLDEGGPRTRYVSQNLANCRNKL